MTTTFCPKCYHPLDDDLNDDARLCSACRWFGDKSEVCHNPPAPTNLELAFVRLLALYRDICRSELLAEQLTKDIPEYSRNLIAIRARVANAGHSILFLIRETRGKTHNETNKGEADGEEE